MKAIDRLASSLNRKDMAPNLELAKDIVQKKNKLLVKELIDLLAHKNKSIRFDSIKVLYEIGEQAPEMIVEFVRVFANLLQSKDNRMIWGAMSAFNSISRTYPESVYKHLAEVILAADKGSVITKDNAVDTLIKLIMSGKNKEECISLLLEQILKSPSNQFPMYAERSMEIIDKKNKKQFIKIFKDKFAELEKDSQKKRIEKILKKLEN